MTSASGAATNFSLSDVLYFNGSTDYIEIYGYGSVNLSTDARVFVTYFSAIGYT